MTFLLWPKYDKKIPGGYFQKNWVGVCGTLPETLTLFQTKICDFPCPISDLIIKWLKNHSLWLGTYLYSLYKRLPPPPPDPVMLKMHCRLWFSLLTQLEPMREKTSLVNDRLSPNSLILVRKATGDELVFLGRNVLERLWNSLERLWTY